VPLALVPLALVPIAPAPVPEFPVSGRLRAMTSTALRMRVGLALLLLLALAGRFLPGIWAWGVNHLAYLPPWFAVAWSVAAAALLSPGIQRRASRWLAEPVPRFLFETRRGPLLVMAAGGLLFWTLGRHSLFLGDGTWLLLWIQDGRPFHSFNLLDYHLRFLLYNWLQGKVSAYALYQGGSILAGVCSLGLQIALLKRLSWEPWRKTAALALLFFMPPVALYFGYIESYAFPLALLTAFLLAGLLVLERRAPLWLASLLFGAACALQLGSVFSAPALVFLVARAPISAARRRWVQGLAPAAALLAGTAILYTLGGYDPASFRKDYLETQIGRSMLVALSGPQGFFSLYHWKDLLNVALITAPVALVVLLASLGRLRGSWRSAPVGFLLVQVIGVAVCRMLLLAKLGGAKDWDLLAAHAAGLPLLAATFLPDIGSDRSAGPHPVVAQAVVAAFLLTAPFVALPNFQDRAITRLIEVTADAPDWVRTYNLEDLARFYRDRNDLDRAGRLYAECVRVAPEHARLRVNLGWIRYLQGNKKEADTCYGEAARLDPTNPVAVQMLGRLAAERGDLAEAVLQFDHLTRLQPDSPAAWKLLGEAAFEARDWPAAARGLGHYVEQGTDAEAPARLGFVLLQMKSYAEAVRAFRLAVAREPEQPSYRVGLGWALVRALEAGGAPDADARAARLAEARSIAQALLAQNPQDPDIQELARAVQGFRP
jgi:tetratricopeptide (TPR) repeat protein